MYAVECLYLIKAHLVRLLGRKRQEAGWLQRRIFHFQRKKNSGGLQRECVMCWNRGSQNVFQGCSGVIQGTSKNEPLFNFCLTSHTTILQDENMYKDYYFITVSIHYVGFTAHPIGVSSPIMHTVMLYKEYTVEYNFIKQRAVSIRPSFNSDHILGVPELKGYSHTLTSFTCTLMALF